MECCPPCSREKFWPSFGREEPRIGGWVGPLTYAWGSFARECLEESKKENPGIYRKNKQREKERKGKVKQERNDPTRWLSVLQ
jgi:hypothetical protein